LGRQGERRDGLEGGREHQGVGVRVLGFFVCFSFKKSFSFLFKTDLKNGFKIVHTSFNFFSEGKCGGREAK
jgi:hypothetical protein